MRSRIVAVALLLLPAGAGAAPLHLVVEPVQVGLEHLDAVHAASGLQSRDAVRLGGGIGLAIGDRWQVAFGAGTAAGRTDFGLIDGTSARLVRTDATLELRARVPGAWHGWGVQAAAGAGRLVFGYHPDRVVLDVQGSSFTVDLPPVRTWTEQVAAELLHPVPGGTWGLRCAWRFYSLDVATPSGIVSTGARDLQLGMLLRVDAF